MVKRLDIETRRAIAQRDGIKKYFTREDKIEGARKSYKNARDRCTTNPTSQFYRWYAAKGVKFLFKSFQELLDDIGPRPTPRHSIDRKPGCRDYAPGSVRWATPKQQSRNRTFPNKMGPKPTVERAKKGEGPIALVTSQKSEFRGGFPERVSSIPGVGGGSTRSSDGGGSTRSSDVPILEKDLWSLSEQKPLMW